MTHEERMRQYLNSVGGVLKDHSYERPLTKEEELELLREARKRDIKDLYDRADRLATQYYQEQKHYMAGLSDSERRQVVSEREESAMRDAYYRGMSPELRRAALEREMEEAGRGR